MRANEQKIASDGYEVCLFPLEVMYLTASRDPDEHDVLALDFLPRTAQGALTSRVPVYAPFTGTIVFRGNNDHNCILQSNNKVHTPQGLKYVRVLVAHSYNEAPALNSEFRQGFQFYSTGNYGQSYGEHLHMEVALVDNPNDRLWNTGGVGLYSADHMWLSLYVDDTIILRGGLHQWLTYGETPPIPGGETLKRKKFPWVLYAKKFRDSRR